MVLKESSSTSTASSWTRLGQAADVPEEGYAFVQDVCRQKVDERPKCYRGQ